MVEKMNPNSQSISKVEHLTLFSLNRNETSPQVLVVGNAYGVLPYQLQLAQHLASRGFQVHWFPFSGQEGTSGHFGVAQGANDLDKIVSYIADSNGDRELHAIAHCAGALLMTEYLSSRNSPLMSLSIYGILYAPWRRRRIAERRLREKGVAFELSEGDWRYPWNDRLARITTPAQLVHSADSLNLDRASKAEVTNACALLGCDCIWFDQGYDNEPDLIPSYCDVYEDFIGAHSRLNLTRKI